MSLTLSKKQTISLEKEAGRTLNAITLGLGWDAAEPKGFFAKLLGNTPNIDLDASCFMLDKNSNSIDLVWFRQLSSKCGNIKHSGDNRTGDGDGDDESITVNLNSISNDVESLVFTVNSFTDQDFSQVKNAYCRIIDTIKNEEIARISLSDQDRHTGLVMAYLKRQGSGWNFTAVGSVARGRTAKDLLSEARAVVNA
jgi:tellurium resistance protein TerZ